MATIGIDLGTTNSLAVAYLDGEVTLIPNEYGEFLTPSVVHVSKNVLTVGKVAKERLVTDSANTAQLFKRSMGTNDSFVLDGQVFTALDLSALVVKQLIADAEKFLGEEVDEVLISVPAYFNDRQRQATKAIGEVLGVKVERLINEPSSAAIACHELGTYELFIVFDFGGGTLDVSVVDCFENVISITAIAGDNFLGGSDFDKAIAEHFCQIQELTFEDMDKDAQASLLLAAERCKLKLQDEETASVSLVVNEEMYFKKYSQDDIREIIKPVLHRVKKVIARAVKESGYTAQDLDYFILVGGSSQMPLVQEYLKQILNIPIKRVADMDELVARGLGTYLAIKERKEQVKDLVVTDICPFSLGVDSFSDEFQKNAFSKIITKNTVLPTTASRYYVTHDLGQSRVQFDIYQGESFNVNSNLKLGEITIDVPVNYQEHEAIKVTFSYDINSLLYIEFDILSTGEHQIYQLGRGKTIDRLTSSSHLDNIKITSSSLNSEPVYDALMERAERICQELPYHTQPKFIEKVAQFSRNYDAAFNNIKKKQEILFIFKQYLDKLESYVYGEDLDIFRDSDDE